MIDPRIEDLFKKLKILEKKVEAIENTLLSVKELATKPFDIEANLREFAEKFGVTSEIKMDAARYATKNRIRMRVGRDIFVTDLKKDNLIFEVISGCSYVLLGIKFLKGNAYGHYRIYEGYLINVLKDFTRSLSDKQSSIAFFPTRFREDERWSIGRIQGEGTSTIAVIGWSARPETLPSALALKEE